jgi:hypothetical protein
VLFGGLAAHTMLETGRDALFLARLSAHQLPWMYLALAAVAVVPARPRPPARVLEALAGERRWHDAVAETAGVLIELDVEDLIDMFEDNVDIALDYLAWLSRGTLELIESRLGPGRELLEFFTTLTASPLPEPANPAEASARGR